MGSFADRLKAEDTQALRAYLIGQAEQARKNPAPAFGGPAPAAPPPREIHDTAR
jgi:hypothetical protein